MIVNILFHDDLRTLIINVVHTVAQRGVFLRHPPWLHCAVVGLDAARVLIDWPREAQAAQ